MSCLTDELDEYLSSRSRMGFTIGHDRDTLRSFVRFCDAAGLTTVTTDAIVEWVNAPADVTSAWLAKRFGVVRLFAIYLHHSDPVHEVPPARLIVGEYQRIAPFLYTADDISSLISAAGKLSGRIRPIAYQTLIGLIVVTGMRISEVLALNLDNIDLDTGLITILKSKFGKSRCLPIHPTTVAALSSYLTTRDSASLELDAATAVFVSDAGRRISYRQCQSTFAQCARAAGIAARSPRCRPRIHDLRHTFAVSTLIDWYAAGTDVNVAMPYLSTYLGHINPASTYWYLTGSPELAAVITGRLDLGAVR